MGRGKSPSEFNPLLRVGLLQGFSFIAYGAAIPFFSLYFKKVLVGANGNPAHFLIGLLFFVQSILGIASTPVAGFISDRFQIENRLLTLFCTFVVFAAVLLTLAGIPPAFRWSMHTRFIIILAGFAIYGLFMKPVMPLIDTETLHVLHNRYNSGIWYGRIRMFGSLGWLVSASLLGWLLNRTGQMYLCAVGWGAGFTVLALIAFSGMGERIRPVHIPWGHLKKDRMFRRFLLFVFFQSFGLMNAFYFTSFFMDDINAGYLVIGVSIGMAALPEIPIMFFSKAIIERIGNRWMIFTGTLFEVLKLIIFVFIAASGKVLWLIPVQLLHGMGFSLRYTGEINLIDRQSHRDMRAIYQSLFHLFTYLASALGSIFASAVIKKLGSSWLMGLDGIILILSALYFLTAVRGHGPSRD